MVTMMVEFKARAYLNEREMKTFEREEAKKKLDCDSHEFANTVLHRILGEYFTVESIKVTESYIEPDVMPGE